MSLSISATAPAQQANAQAPAPAPARQATQSQASADTVTLSESAQIIQMNQQGQAPQLIALDLEIPVSTVDSDLGLNASAAGTVLSS